jgi:hypothetical protein
MSANIKDMPNLLSSPNYHKYRFPIELLYAQLNVPDWMGINTSVQESQQIAYQQLALYLKKMCLSSPVGSSKTNFILYPDGWWQAFKEEHFPEWAKKRFPVRWRKHEYEAGHISNICPHANIDFGKDPKPHWDFLLCAPVEYLEGHPDETYPLLEDSASPIRIGGVDFRANKDAPEKEAIIHPFLLNQLLSRIGSKDIEWPTSSS